MLIRQSAPALIAICILNGFSGASVLAADLSIASTSMSPRISRTAENARTKKQQTEPRMAEPAKRNRSKNNRATIEKARKPGKVVYDVFGDARFKFAGAGKTPFGTGKIGMGIGSDPSHTNWVSPPSALLTNRPAPQSTTAYKTDTATNTGIAFDCRGKPAYTGNVPRELTACYVHNLDKGWKTQTYLSKGFAEGSAGWGGGLSLGFAY